MIPLSPRLILPSPFPVSPPPPPSFSPTSSPSFVSSTRRLDPRLFKYPLFGFMDLRLYPFKPFDSVVIHRFPSFPGFPPRIARLSFKLFPRENWTPNRMNIGQCRRYDWWEDMQAISFPVPPFSQQNPHLSIDAFVQSRKMKSRQDISCICNTTNDLLWRTFFPFLSIHFYPLVNIMISLSICHSSVSWLMFHTFPSDTCPFHAFLREEQHNGFAGFYLLIIWYFFVIVFSIKINLLLATSQ